MGGEDGGICMGQVTDGFYAEELQRPGRRFSDHKQIPDGKRPHLLGDFFGKKGVDTIRLCEIRGHLCKEPVGGNTVIHCKTEAVPDMFTDDMGAGNGDPPSSGKDT